MADRYDIITAREYKDRDGNTKTAFTRIGTAFPGKGKDGFMLLFDALPISGPDGCKAFLKPYEPKPVHDKPAATGLDDEIPF